MAIQRKITRARDVQPQAGLQRGSRSNSGDLVETPAQDYLAYLVLILIHEESELPSP